MRFAILIATGLVLGSLSWGLADLISGEFEPFDNATGFFVCQIVLVLPSLAIGLRIGMLRALLMLSGAWVGMNGYAYLFGGSETRAWIMLLLLTSLSLLAFPAIAGISGGIVRAILRKSRSCPSTAPH